ncbi:MAG: ABC transporter ATP-binding protein [Clostridia bacterium]|nr:ABC transporter ATP-binding protein [Clostridia bacterium]
MPKQKMDFGALKKIFAYCKPYLPAIIISIVCAVMASITTIIGPEKISDLMNTITGSVMLGVDIDMGEVIEICIFLICLYLSGAIFSYVQQFIMSVVTQKSSKKLRTDINKKINKLPLAYFDKTTKGDILSRVTNDVDTISQTLGSSVANLVSSVVLFIGVIFKMFQTNWILALVTIGSSLLGFMVMGIILGKSQKYFNKRQVYLGDMNGHIEETYTNYNIVKSYNGTKIEKGKFGSTNNKIYNVEWKSHFMSGMMMPIMNFVGNLSYLLIFAVGVSIIVSGGTSVTIGTLIAFIIYARLFSQPLSTFAQSMQSMQQASAASNRVFEMLEAKELDDESHKTLKLNSVKGDVEFKDIKFGYLEDKEIIKGFSAKLSAGQKVAIVGPTGAGKTTIVNLLMRFYEVNSGDILIDGKSIKEIKREDVHDLFDMILQDTWLFGGTIRENLVYNKQNVPDSKLDEVCEAVGLSHYISTLEQGYDTVLTDTSSLSEGQKQQLTIARAMIKDAPLLILDEATSNVDTRTELVIQKAMDELTKGRTSFIIAHRLSTIRNADVILVLKDGDIIEQGNHEQLLEQNGFYAQLYNSQFEEDD